MPRSAQPRKIAAVEASARSQASILCCCEPTWNEMPYGDKPAPVRELQDVDRVVRLAAELARERPFRAGAVAMDAADHAATGRGARDLLDLGLAIDREQRDAEPVRGGDLALFLDRVAVGDAIRRAAGREHHFGLGHRGDVEAGAELGQELDDFRCRVRLHGVEDARVGQRLGEGEIVLAHDLVVEHEAGAFVVAAASGIRGCVRSSELFPNPNAQPWRPRLKVNPCDVRRLREDAETPAPRRWLP